MRIRVKVKHVVYSLSGLLALFLLFIFVLQPQLEIKRAEQALLVGDLRGKQQVIKLLEDTKSKPKRLELIRTFMEGQLTEFDHHYDVYIASGFTQVSHDNPLAKQMFAKDEKIPYLLEYIEQGPANYFTVKAALELAAYYLEQGQYTSAEDLLLSTNNKMTIHGWHDDSLLLQCVQVYMHQEKWSEAEALLLQIKNNEAYYPSEAWTKLKAELSLRQGEYEQALQELEEGIEDYSQFMQEANKRFAAQEGDNDLRLDVDPRSLTAIKQQLERALASGATEISVVKGTVRHSDGSPVAQAGVFLRDQSSMNRSVSQWDAYQTRTSADGSYMIVGVLPGHYQIGLGLSFEQVDGWAWPVNTDQWLEVRANEELSYPITLQPLINVRRPVNYEVLNEKELQFEWDEVEGAAYYELSLGVHYQSRRNSSTSQSSGSISTIIRSHIPQNHVQLTVDELYGHKTGLSYDYGEDDELYVQPETLLGFANPQGEFSWSIKAFDHEGQLLSQSNGYRLKEETVGNLPFFSLQERELTTADRLLLKGDINQAREAYEQAYTRNPDDIHALRMFLRLYDLDRLADSTGTGQMAGTWASKREQVYPYIKALAEREQSSAEIYDLVSYYYEQQMWTEYNEWYARYLSYLKQQQEPVGNYPATLHALALMRQGKVDEAQTQFATCIPLDQSHRFIGSWLALEVYMGTSPTRILEMAQSYPQRDWVVVPVWRELLAEVYAEQEKSPAAVDYLEEGLRLYIEGNTEELAAYVQQGPFYKQRLFLQKVLEVR